MSGTFHPARHGIGSDLIGRVPVIGLLSTSSTNRAVQVSLKYVLGESFGDLVAGNLSARVADGFSASSRILAIGIHVTEEIPTRHVLAVSAGNSGKLLVELKHGEFVIGSFPVDEGVDAFLQVRDADRRLPRALEDGEDQKRNQAFHGAEFTRRTREAECG